MEKLLYHHLAEWDFNMEKLNSLESSIIECILIENKERYSFLNFHIPYLYIKNRECTGVGTYSNFEYAKDVSTEEINDLLSSEKRLIIKGIKNELSYTLAITKGKISFLEIITNGNEAWNGKFKSFKLE